MAEFHTVRVAAIIGPTEGRVVAGPLYGEEGIVLADCDLRDGLHAKRWFDAVGHYAREDVLAPLATLTGSDGGPKAEAIPQPHEQAALHAQDLGA